MSILTIFLYALIVVISLLLIALILIQPSKSGGMGAAFGGIGEAVFGGKAGSHLTKTTVVLTTIFFVIALLLAALIGHGGGKPANDALKKARAEQVEAAKKAESAAALSAPQETGHQEEGAVPAAQK